MTDPASPFIKAQDRPDLTVAATGSQTAPKPIKEILKDIVKEITKDQKEHKDLKDHIKEIHKENLKEIEKQPIDVAGPGHVGPGEPVEHGVSGVAEDHGLTPGKP